MKNKWILETIDNTLAVDWLCSIASIYDKRLLRYLLLLLIIYIIVTFHGLKSNICIDNQVFEYWMNNLNEIEKVWFT